jgi:hypothetical protein
MLCDLALEEATRGRVTGFRSAGVAIRHAVIGRRERWRRERMFSHPSDAVISQVPQGAGFRWTGRAGAEQRQGAADRASRRGGLVLMGAHTEAKEIICRSQTYRRHSACVTPSVACGLGRASAPTTPASPPRRKRLSWRAKRLTVRTAPCRCAPAPLPSSGVSAASLPVPRKPHPRGRTPAWASDTPRQRER